VNIPEAEVKTRKKQFNIADCAEILKEIKFKKIDNNNQTMKINIKKAALNGQKIIEPTSSTSQYSSTYTISNKKGQNRSRKLIELFEKEKKEYIINK